MRFTLGVKEVEDRDAGLFRDRLGQLGRWLTFTRKEKGHIDRRDPEFYGKLLYRKALIFLIFPECSGLHS
jgi:hypothetical protein